MTASYELGKTRSLVRKKNLFNIYSTIRRHWAILSRARRDGGAGLLGELVWRGESDQ